MERAGVSTAESARPRLPASAIFLSAVGLTVAATVGASAAWGVIAGCVAGLGVGVATTYLATARLRLLAAGAADVEQIDAALTEDGDELGDIARALTRSRLELERMHEQVVRAERMASFGALGAGITHEVKNPITALVGFAQLAQKRIDDREKVLELLRIIESEGLRCRDILSNFLKFARGASRTWARIDLNQVVQETAKVLRHQLVVGGVQLETRLRDVPPVFANTTELQQVIVNLALNAQQAMPEGGMVIVATRTEGESAVLTVSDNGPGIPEDVRSRLFEPFFSTKAAGVGTGLGLAISAGIVKAHKGELAVESRVGQGTTFTIRLPLAGGGEGTAAAG